MVTQPTRLSTNNKRTSTSSYTDRIYLSGDDFYSQAVSVPIGGIDHNVVAIARKSKVPKAKPTVSFLKDVSNICWSDICNVREPDGGL